MITIRAAEDRGRLQEGDLDTRHSFSMGGHLDPSWHHFHALRLVHEKRLQPKGSTLPQNQRDLEVLTWVLSGELNYSDDMDHVGTVGPGDLLRLSTGIGLHAVETNPSSENSTHYLQIGVFPEETGGPPHCAQRHFPLAERLNAFRLIASQTGEGDSLAWQTETRLYTALLDDGSTATLDIPVEDHAWVQVVRGRVSINDQDLRAGDGARISQETHLVVKGQTQAEVLLLHLR